MIDECDEKGSLSKAFDGDSSTSLKTKRKGLSWSKGTSESFASIRDRIISNNTRRATEDISTLTCPLKALTSFIGMEILVSKC